MLKHDATLLDGEQDYFAACVAPAAKDKPEYADAANSYQGLIGQHSKAKAISIRTCECGALLPPRKRYCDKCSRQRCLTSKRATWAKTRQLMPKTSS